MKKYCKIFFFILPLFFTASIAKCAITPIVSTSHHICNKADISVLSPGSTMNGNKPASTRQLLLFRNGVDQKSILYSYSIYKNPTLLLALITDAASINAGRVKFILSFSHFHPIQQEFLSSYSCHAPPFSFKV